MKICNNLRTANTPFNVHRVADECVVPAYISQKKNFLSKVERIQYVSFLYLKGTAT
jgi:hypothetical protein